MDAEADLNLEAVARLLIEQIDKLAIKHSLPLDAKFEQARRYDFSRGRIIVSAELSWWYRDRRMTTECRTLIEPGLITNFGKNNLTLEYQYRACDPNLEIGLAGFAGQLIATITAVPCALGALDNLRNGQDRAMK